MKKNYLTLVISLLFATGLVANKISFTHHLGNISRYSTQAIGAYTGRKVGHSLTYMVYKTPYGEKYHRIRCRYVRGKNLTEMSIPTAQRYGLTPCKVCHP